LAGAYRFQARCDLICRAPADALIYIEEILNLLDGLMRRLAAADRAWALFCGKSFGM
jgi:hypothetical protein